MEIGNNTVTESDTTHLIKSERDYEKIFAVNVQVKAGFGPVSAYAKTSYENTFKESSSSSSTIIFNEVVIRNKLISLPEDPPNLSAEFENAVKLLDPSQKGTFQTFVKKYGTHYISDARLGGRAIIKKSITQEQLSQLNQDKVDIEAGIEAVMGPVKAGASAGTSSKEVSKFSQITGINASMITYIGGNSSISKDSWKKSVENGENPAIIISSFRPISEMLSKFNFPDDEQILTKNDLLDKAIREYIEPQNETKILLDLQARVGPTVAYTMSNVVLGKPDNLDPSYLAIGDVACYLYQVLPPNFGLKNIDENSNNPAILPAETVREFFRTQDGKFVAWSLHGLGENARKYSGIGYIYSYSFNGTHKTPRYDRYCIIRNDLLTEGKLGDENKVYLNPKDFSSKENFSFFRIIPDVKSFGGPGVEGINANIYYPAFEFPKDVGSINLKVLKESSITFVSGDHFGNAGFNF